MSSSFIPAKHLAQQTLQVRHQAQSGDLLKQALIFFNQGNFSQAENLLNQILKFQPKNVDALNIAGVVASQLSNFKNSVDYFSKAIKINPLNESYYANRGNALIELHDYEMALLNFNKAIAINSKYAMAYSGKGVALCALNKYEEAIDSLGKAINLSPEFVQAYQNRGDAYLKLQKSNEALRDFDTVIQLNPQNPVVYLGKANALKNLGKLPEALDSLLLAVKLNKHYVEAYYNMGVIYGDLNYKQDAIAAYDKAIEIDESYVEAHWNKGLVLLGEKEFEAGWPLYAWRWKREETHSNFMSLPKPLVEDLNKVSDKNILVWAEQGVGDQVMYAGLLLELFDISPYTQVLIDGRLIPLLSRAMPQAHFIDKNTPVNQIAYEMHIPIGDLGKNFRKSAADFEKTKAAYLIADKKRAEILRNQLLQGKQLLCGITWHSGRDTTGVNKSMQLGDLLPVLKLAGISFVSLQYGDMSEELAEFNRQTGTEIQACESVDNFKDLDGHAALIEACDFVVTISNTSAHIAGAIGKDTYLLYPKGRGALWYWLNQAHEKSMWYPSIKIYQQQELGQWTEPVHCIKQILEKKIHGAS